MFSVQLQNAGGALPVCPITDSHGPTTHDAVSHSWPVNHSADPFARHGHLSLTTERDLANYDAKR